MKRMADSLLLSNRFPLAGQSELVPVSSDFLGLALLLPILQWKLFPYFKQSYSSQQNCHTTSTALPELTVTSGPPQHPLLGWLIRPWHPRWLPLQLETLCSVSCLSVFGLASELIEASLLCSTVPWFFRYSVGGKWNTLPLQGAETE